MICEEKKAYHEQNPTTILKTQTQAESESLSKH